MTEATETPTTPTEGTTSPETTATTLLSSSEPVATTQQQQETPKEGTTTEDPKTEEPAKLEGAPESYDFKAPEGSTYDPAVMESFSEAAKEANLTQDAAQKLLEKMAPAVAARQMEQVKAVQTGWLEASKSDKEFGGDKLPENLAVAKKAMDTYASPALKTLLNDTGLGSNPEVIRLFFKVGQTLKEDSFVTGSAKVGTKSAAEVLYDNTK